jgi:hypothetical protein
MRHRISELWWKNADFCVFSVAVMAKCFEAFGWGNSISDGVLRHQRVPVIEGHRLPSTASRRDIR